MTTVFVDQDARDAIANQPNMHAFVEAGAGTGKTTALVARIVGLLASGQATIGSLVIITFTEAAAGELRERLRTALERKVRDGTSTESVNCSQALSNLETAVIQTIHGFAHRIVTQFALQLAIPPSFVVNDSVQSQLLFEKQWQDFVSGSLGPAGHLNAIERETVEIAIALGFTARHFKELVRKLGHNWHRARALADAPVTSFSAPDITALMNMVEQVESGFAFCRDHTDTLWQWRSEKFGPWVKRLKLAVADGSDTAVVEALRMAPSFKADRKGNKKKWLEEKLLDQRILIADLEALHSNALGGPRRWCLHGLTVMAARIVISNAYYRRREGLLNFDDLLIYAQELVSRPLNAGALRANYRYVFVDEFQDTDDRQVALIDALTQADDDPGAFLFTVGDPKQSIYRFRGADVGQFQAVKARGHARMFELTTNFRSASRVVDWVNASVSSMVSETLETRAHLHAGRSEDLASPVGSVHVIGDQLSDARARDVREREAGEVVSTLVRAKADGWAVFNENGGRRPIQFRDMTVLMPTRRSLPALERELQKANVPFRVESRSLLWVTQEVRDLIAVLSAIDDPRNEVAVVAALRTPAMACGDDDLFMWRRNGGSWDYRSVSPDATLRVGQAFERLRSLRMLRGTRTVSQLVSEIIEQLHLYEQAFARSRQREAWHRLRFVVDRARAWCDEGGGDLHEFLRWIDTQVRESAEAVETVVPEADDDAVRIMTIHASKGLEFPLVAIVGLGSRDTVTDSVRVLWTDSTWPEIRIGGKDAGWQTSGFESVAASDADEERAEQARLLYVAATRARDHLVVSVHRQMRGSGQSLADRLVAFVEAPTSPTAVPCVEVSRRTLAPNSRAPKAKVSRRSEIIARASSPTMFTATYVSDQNNVDGEHGASTNYRHHSVRNSDMALRLGSAVHAALAELELSADLETIEQLAKVKAIEFDLPSAIEIVSSVTSALHGECAINAQQAARHWREVPVYCAVGDKTVGGVVDLMYELNSELVVADYKTDDIRDGHDLRKAVAHHQWQLATYALAIQRSVGRVVSRGALVFVPPEIDEAKTVWIHDLEKLAGELATRFDAAEVGVDQAQLARLL
jgi:ATP-dependent helicase/nuclease subunit A